MRSGRRPSQQSRLIRSALGVFVRAVDAWCTLYAGLLLTAPHSTNTKKYRSVLTHNERKGQQQKRHTDATNQKPLRYANKIAAIFLRFFLRFFLVVFSRQKIDRIIKYEKMTIDRRTYNSWGEMHLQNDHTRSKTKTKQKQNKSMDFLPSFILCRRHLISWSPARFTHHSDSYYR